MEIYIDEAGVFVVPPSGDRYVCCHVALIVPSSQVKTVLFEFLRLRDLWRRTEVEVKGSSLDADQIAAVVEMLLRFDVIACVVAIDMARHSDADVSLFKEAQAEGVTKNLTPAHNAALVQYSRQLRDRWRSLPNQLFVQTLTSIMLIEDVVQTGTLYYSQCLPEELSEFQWVIDAKDRELTEYEKLWTAIILPILETGSLSKPLDMMIGADYSYFRRFFFEHASADAEGIRHLEWLRELAGESFSGIDIGKLLQEHRRFSNSKGELRLQLVDTVSSAFFRALNGTLARDGWVKLGGLLVAKKPSPLHFMALSSGAPVGTVLTEHPSADIVRAIEAQARSMWPSR